MSQEHALTVEHARPISNRANDCVPQESHTRPRSHSTPPTDSQQVSQGRGRRKKVTGMATGVQSISSQAKERRSGLKAQGRSADAPPTFTTSLHPICESEDAYDSGTGAFQQFVPSVTEYISGVTGHDSDVEMDGSEGEFNGGTDTDISLNVDDGDNISDDELDGDITRLMYCLKPVAARGAPKYQKRQPGKPKGISKPALMDPVSDDKPKTCAFMIQCAIHRPDGSNSLFQVSSDISLNNLRYTVDEKLMEYETQ
ncbi:hypothetical protein SCLCIDRAFT_23774 [Scleroderma citrinum Foug A]|uniref:Uncharacterized protein n=1 Tax=Scleroderma citrinum Foug A TaxID=1036808 RepID=A0A0C2ZRQ6_9AGAM|nr:hypothetical protein SCLCIDRAFT_23774 [Scleroderma citrinum Foug A]